ncbi:MAG: hypothetical protein JWR65_2076 [Massilia sp.]|nr:hypothetical protein [Massilia sp.]
MQTPPSTAWVPGVLPAGLDKLPLPTLVIRQTGEAWARPFTAVFEAVKGNMAASVLGVEEIVPRAVAGNALGLRVTTALGRHQTIMSTDDPRASTPTPACFLAAGTVPSPNCRADSTTCF